jgi:SanA protein
MKKDIIVVLGNGINKDGTLPKIAKKRVEKARALYKKGVANKILMSGRWGAHIDFIPPITEAKAMKAYAVSLGVKPSKIFCEEKSRDTVTNLFFARKLFLDPRRWKRIMIVTSEYHITRTKYIAKKVFGSDFEVDFEECDSGISKQELKQKIKKEKRDIIITKLAAWGISDGDFKRIENLVTNEHPSYAKKPGMKTRMLMKLIKKYHK